MALSNEWTEWHLTPTGWKGGKCKTDFAATTNTDKETPADRVLTVKFSDYRSSMYSKPDQEHTELWRSDDSKVVEALLKEFGPAPSVI